MEDKNRLLPRHFAAPLELKQLQADGKFAGYASVFGVVDSQRDIVRRGAFRASLQVRAQPVKLLWQHRWDTPIGVITSIFEDERGLYVEGQLMMEVAQAREAYALLRAGALKGLSIGFTTRRARHDPDTGVRELIELELWEVSLVTMPANEAAQVTVIKESSPEMECASLAWQIERAASVLLN